MSTPTVKELYEIYYAVPGDVRARGEWRMGAATLDALEKAYGPKSDGEDQPDDGKSPKTVPALLFGLPIVVDERFPSPRVVEKIDKPVVLTPLTREDVEQILRALRDRGYHKSSNAARRRLCARLEAYADGFLAGSSDDQDRQR